MELMEKIKSSFQRGQIVWRQHALSRMMERDISRQDVFNAIQNGQIIEAYDESTPYEGFLIFGTAEKKPLHIVISWDEENCISYIITSYVPDEHHFELDWKTRKIRRE